MTTKKTNKRPSQACLASWLTVLTTQSLHLPIADRRRYWPADNSFLFRFHVINLNANTQSALIRHFIIRAQSARPTERHWRFSKSFVLNVHHFKNSLRRCLKTIASWQMKASGLWCRGSNPSMILVLTRWQFQPKILTQHDGSSRPLLPSLLHDSPTSRKLDVTDIRNFAIGSGAMLGFPDSGQ
jgi:hypothetical protein